MTSKAGTHIDVKERQDAQVAIRIPIQSFGVDPSRLVRISNDVVMRKHDALG